MLVCGRRTGPSKPGKGPGVLAAARDLSKEEESEDGVGPMADGVVGGSSDRGVQDD